MDRITVKKGDTFSVSCQRVDGSGNPISLVGYTVTSLVRSTKGFSDTLTVSITSAANGEFSISATAAETATWPVSKSIDGTPTNTNLLYCDVQYASGALVESSETFIINVIEDVTNV